MQLSLTGPEAPASYVPQGWQVDGHMTMTFGSPSHRPNPLEDMRAGSTAPGQPLPDGVIHQHEPLRYMTLKSNKYELGGFPHRPSTWPSVKPIRSSAGHNGSAITEGQTSPEGTAQEVLSVYGS